MEPPLKFLSRRNEGSDWAGFLESGSRVEGTLELPGTFRIDGSVKGRVISRHLLVLGETAEVEGEIEGENVTVYGRFKGTLRAAVRVEIHSTATVSGDIYTPCMILDPGGTFDGHCYLSQTGTDGDPLLVPIRANSREGIDPAKSSRDRG